MAERIQCRWCGHERATDGGPSPHCTEGWKCAHLTPEQSKAMHDADTKPTPQRQCACGNPARFGWHGPHRCQHSAGVKGPDHA